MVQPAAVEAAIQRAIPDTSVTVEDLTGGGDHLQVSVVSTAFVGLSRIKQHQLVYGALQAELASRPFMPWRSTPRFPTAHPQTPPLPTEIRIHGRFHPQPHRRAGSFQPDLRVHEGLKIDAQCGFSNNVVQILHSLGVSFETFDVLSDPEIRRGIKEFSSWPTIPQVYVKGELSAAPTS